MRDDLELKARRPETRPPRPERRRVVAAPFPWRRLVGNLPPRFCFWASSAMLSTARWLFAQRLLTRRGLADALRLSHGLLRGGMEASRRKLALRRMNQDP